jgi:hypothetical protein
VQAVEGPELLEAVEAAEHVGEGDSEGTNRRLGRKRSRREDSSALGPTNAAQSSQLQAQ